jgi:glutathione S-transferase
MSAAMWRLVIGNKNTSSWSLRPWLAMKHLRLPFEEIAVDLRAADKKSRILVHSPSGKVPALEVDGLTIWDSLAILEYLAECHPDRGLWPRDGQARALARSASAEMHSGFQALREHCPMDVLGRAPMSVVPDAVEADVRRIVALWRELRGRFGVAGPFLFGDFTAADAMFAPVASRFRTYLPDLTAYGDDGAAAGYVAAIFAMPEMAEWEAGARAELAARSGAAAR